MALLDACDGSASIACAREQLAAQRHVKKGIAHKGDAANGPSAPKPQTEDGGDTAPLVHRIMSGLAEQELAQRVREQAKELRADAREIALLKHTIALPSTTAKGSALPAARRSGSTTERDRIDKQERQLNEEWAALRRRREAREERAKVEDREFEVLSKRLAALEAREEEDRQLAESRHENHDQRMKVLRILAGAMGTPHTGGVTEGGEAAAAEALSKPSAVASSTEDANLRKIPIASTRLDFRPPPYPQPPGHGRLGPAKLPAPPGLAEGARRAIAVSDRRVQELEAAIAEGEAEEMARAQGRRSVGGETGETWYDNKAVDTLKSDRRQRRRLERWGDYPDLYRDSMARAAFGGQGVQGAGADVVREEQHGEMTSAAEIPRMSLPDVFPSDIPK